MIYETESMKKADAADLGRRLEAAGFALVDADQDTVALRRDTETFRKRARTINEVRFERTGNVVEEA